MHLLSRIVLNQEEEKLVRERMSVDDYPDPLANSGLIRSKLFSHKKSPTNPTPRKTIGHIVQDVSYLSCTM